MIRPLAAALALATLFVAPGRLPAQAGKFPPDSLINVKVFPKNTPVPQLLTAMRGFAEGLGEHCAFCHVGEEGQPLTTYDFASDRKRTKLVARQMMLMVREVNRRLDTIPREPHQVALTASCATCHRGVSRPVALSTILVDAASTPGGADSALKAYRSLHDRYYGRDSYDFGEGSLNTAAFRLAQAGKFDQALALLKQNEQAFPKAASVYVSRGNIALMRGDTSGATGAFREALRRDSTSREARGRLQSLGQKP